MSLTLAAAPSGTRVGFVAAGSSTTQVVVTVAPKIWRPNKHKVVTLNVGPELNHYDLTLFETDLLHTQTGNAELHSLLERCTEVASRTAKKAPKSSRLLTPEVRPTPTALRRAPQLRPNADKTTAVDLIRLFSRLDLLQPHADDLRALAGFSPLHRPLLYRRFLDEVFARVPSARRGYIPVTSIRTSIRGKLSPASALRHAHSGDPRVECQYDELTESTDLLGIVCAGLEAIADGQGFHSPFDGRFNERHLRSDAVLLRRALQGVAALAPVKALALGPRLHLPRLDQAWTEALQLSLAILGEKEPTAGPRGSRISDAVELSVGTDKLWERIVSEVLERCGFGRVIRQAALPQGLVVDPWLAKPVTKTQTRPDNIAWRDRELWIVDAKYKMRESTPNRQDQYQLFAYSHLVRDVGNDVHAVLSLYPGDDRTMVWTRGRDDSHTPVRLIACSVPFPEPEDVRTNENWESYLDAAAHLLGSELAKRSV